MVAIIGDIHGCIHTLRSLVKKITQKYPSIRMYSVGDLVDRGNFAYEVLEFIQSEKIKFTPGNHDYMMYYFIKYPTHEIGRSWPHNGFETTLTSYNQHFDKLNEHLDFIIKQPLFYDLDDCFISHAGISKNLKNQLPIEIMNDHERLNTVLQSNLNNESGILWTRDHLLNLGKLQIVGHSIKKEVTRNEKTNAVYIDTGVYLGNKLSAVVIERNEIKEIFSEPTHEIDIQKSI